MITFFVTPEGSFGIRNYLATRGRSIADRVAVLSYDDLGALSSVPVTGTIFAALDQLTPAALAAATAIAEKLDASDPGVTILNRPGRALTRYALLRRLHESGHNRFTVIRATADPATLRYPVFVRYEHRHAGSLTPVLRDRTALDRALGELVFRGVPLGELLIVEYCDAVGSDGLYRKYSAMRVGETILARHLHASTSWVAKSQNAVVDETLVREELEYVTTNPHEAWLRQVFDLAGIGYGRIDYGISDGQPQAWEINMNPTFARGTKPSGEARRDAYRDLREASRVALNDRMLAAFQAIEAAGPPKMLPIALDAAIRQQLASEQRARQRAAALGRLTRGLVDNPLSRVLKDAVRPAVRRMAPMVGRLARHRG